jgi:hypothetical protein
VIDIVAADNSSRLIAGANSLKLSSACLIANFSFVRLSLSC